MTDTPSQQLPEDLGRRFITGLHETLSGAADALGDLDRRAGDGDFGTNVRTAMKLATKNLEKGAPSSYRDWVGAMSMAWLGVGGTSGPLFGMFFRDVAKAGAADGGGEGSAGGGGGSAGGGGVVPTLAQFTDGLAAGQAVVQKYGEAEVGDKTMIDSLAPAIAALRDALAAGTDPSAALAEAERAAVDAARATAETTARRGRASYVGDVSKGVIDPGAAAMALVIGAARAAVDGGEVDTGWIA